MRLVTIRIEGREEAAIVSPGGPLPVCEINGFRGGETTDLLSLLESGRFHELKSLYDGGEVEGEAVPFDRFEYGPLYRRPRKIWGIGLNYVEHAGDLEETAPAEEPASFMRPDTTIIGPGEDIQLPKQSERVTGEAELGLEQVEDLLLPRLPRLALTLSGGSYALIRLSSGRGPPDAYKSPRRSRMRRSCYPP